MGGVGGLKKLFWDFIICNFYEGFLYDFMVSD